MLKIMFWLLLLVNGVLFALHQGYLGSSGSERHEAERLRQQLHADKLTLLSASSANAGAAVVASTAPPPPPPATATAAACIEIGDFNHADSSRFAAQLAALGLQAKAAAQPLTDSEPGAGYMVYLAAAADRATRERELAELQRLELKDFFVLPAGAALPGAVSLGVFKTEEGAKAQLANLQKKGLRGARIQGRGAVARQLFQLRGLDSEEQTALEQLRAEFPAQHTRACRTGGDAGAATD